MAGPEASACRSNQPVCHTVPRTLCPPPSSQRSPNKLMDILPAYLLCWNMSTMTPPSGRFEVTPGTYRMSTMRACGYFQSLPQRSWTFTLTAPKRLSCAWRFKVRRQGQPFAFHLKGAVMGHRLTSPTRGAPFPVEGVKQVTPLSSRLFNAQPLCLAYTSYSKHGRSMSWLGREGLGRDSPAVRVLDYCHRSEIREINLVKQ